MVKGLSAAQRRAVRGSDPSTGRVSARAQVCEALVAAGLAVRYGRGGHHYLTPDGLRVRAELGEADEAPRGGPPDTQDAPDTQDTHGGFVADDGTGAAPAPGPGRSAEVAAAWAGLLQIRSVLQDGATDTPAPWERERCVHAVALALEAAGCPPSHPAPANAAGTRDALGYTVTPSPYPGTARVSWSPASGADAERALRRIAGLLAPHGWQATHHRTRAGEPYLLVSPRR
jgi:hypothetical protein